MTGRNIKPFKFEPILKTVLWGGDRILPFKGMTATEDKIGESWEVSGVKGNESIVANGPDKGKTLTQLIEEYGADLVGEENLKKYGNTFPLLIKLIDAKQDLSLQVHPDDKVAMERHNSFGKTEMWYIIDTKPESIICAGLSEKITPEEYTQRVENDTLMDVVAHHKSHRGDIFFLPAGRIHSICAGNLLLEVQQTSDITYRLYDFNRVDANGQKRELHTELAKDAIDYKVYDNYVTKGRRLSNNVEQLVKCDYFTVSKINVIGTKSVNLQNKDSFVILSCIEGMLTFMDNFGNTCEFKQGETILVPASASAIVLTGNGIVIKATSI